MTLVLTKSSISSMIDIPSIFFATTTVNATFYAYSIKILPRLMAQSIISSLVHVFYRVRVVHGERIPQEGSALLVCNHVSYLDAFFIYTAISRPIRFVMSNRIYHNPFLNWFFRFCDAIPIAPPREDAAVLASAYERCVKALTEGELICIFPEGKRTQNGDVATFLPGVNRILRCAPVPVVPMALQGLWGSVFSRDVGARMPRPLRKGVKSAITLSVGELVPPGNATPSNLHQIVGDLFHAHL